MRCRSRSWVLVTALLLGATDGLQASTDPSAVLGGDGTDGRSAVIGTATLLCPSRIAFTIMQAGNYACELLPFLFSQHDPRPEVGARVASWVPTRVDRTESAPGAPPDASGSDEDTEPPPERGSPAPDAVTGEGLLGR